MPAVQAPSLETKVKKPHGKQISRNAAWPAEKGGHQQHRTWETKVKKSTERQMNRNAAWPAEKGGHQQYRHRTWQTTVKKSHGRQMNGHAAWPAEKGGHQSDRKGGHISSRFVSQVCNWCPPFSAGDATFLFFCLPGLSLVVSALFRWPCSISIHLPRRSVAAGVRPFPLAM